MNLALCNRYSVRISVGVLSVMDFNFLEKVDLLIAIDEDKSSAEKPDSE